MYGSALSSLRGVRSEQSSLFNFKKKEKSSSPHSWTHKFVCLPGTDADRVPTAHAERRLLEEAGLGEKVVEVGDLNCSPEVFRDVLNASYPKLRGGGGFELLRCLPNSRELVVMGPKVCSSPPDAKEEGGER